MLCDKCTTTETEVNSPSGNKTPLSSFLIYSWDEVAASTENEGTQPKVLSFESNIQRCIYEAKYKVVRFDPRANREGSSHHSLVTA